MQAKFSTSLPNTIEKLISQENLPTTFKQTIRTTYQPLAEEIAKLTQTRKKNQPLIIGINGSQGSGKSTLATFLCLLLKQKHQFLCANLSLDDFYHTPNSRQTMAKEQHPLFATRGVPGTHDIQLLETCLKQLTSASKQQPALIPRFDKSTDNRKPTNQWDKMIQPPDIILLEGWCLGITAEDPQNLNNPINELEKIHDSKAIWRNHINEYLRNDYQNLFKKIDWLIFLKAPNFECVYQWRLLQEQKLAKQTHQNKVMSSQQIRNFIQYFERLTNRDIMELPKKANKVLQLNTDHSFKNP